MGDVGGVAGDGDVLIDGAALGPTGGPAGGEEGGQGEEQGGPRGEPRGHPGGDQASPARRHHWTGAKARNLWTA